MKLPLAASVILAAHRFESALADCVDYPTMVYTKMGKKNRNVIGYCSQLEQKRNRPKHKKPDIYKDERSAEARKTARCENIKGAKQVCPVTCGKCDECADPPSEVEFWVSGEGQNRNCDWVSENTSTRCDMTNNVCRLTCGQCTPPTVSPAPSKAPPPLAPARVRQGQHQGLYHSCATIDNVLKCWGQNNYGQLGDGTTVGKAAPTKVLNIKSGQTVKSFSAGSGHTCAILDDTTLQCWGLNSFGQLGDGTTTNKSYPVTVNLGERYALSIECSNLHTCALLDDFSVKCWGRTGYLGKSSSNSGETNLVPGSVVDFGDNSYNVDSIVSGAYHTCAVLNSGASVQCWGSNTNGQLGRASIGIGGSHDSAAPVENLNLVSGQTVSSVHAGFYFSCVVLSDGTAKCWGNHDYSQHSTDITDMIADDDFAMSLDDYIDPTKLDFDSGLYVKEMGLGGWTTCVILSDDSLRCWGRNDEGQAGSGSVGPKQPTPVVIGFSDGAYATSVSLGLFHTCATLSDGSSLKCWGSNTNGQVGSGDATAGNYFTPTSVTNLF